MRNIKKIFNMLCLILLLNIIFVEIILAANNNEVLTIIGKPITEENFKYYCQYGGVNSKGELSNRSQWNTNSCDIEGTGCGPTSLAMILSTFGYSINPNQVAMANRRMGCGGAAGGTNSGDIESTVTPWLKRIGFTISNNLSSGGNVSVRSIDNFLSNNYLILGGAYVRFWTNDGWSTGTNDHCIDGYCAHAFVIAEKNSNGTYKVYDPTFCENGKAGGQRNLSNISNLSLYGTDNVRLWKFAFAIKKK